MVKLLCCASPHQSLEWNPYLHHDSQVFDVVLLCLNELVQDKPEHTNHSVDTSVTSLSSAVMLRITAV